MRVPHIYLDIKMLKPGQICDILLITNNVQCQARSCYTSFFSRCHMTTMTLITIILHVISFVQKKNL